MAHTGVFATSSEILSKAGENYDTGMTEAKINELCLQAESLINVASKVNFTDKWNAGSLNVDVKYLLTMAESAWVAMKIIEYNMAGYTNKAEVALMLNVLRDEFQTAYALLRSMDSTDWMVGA